MKPPIEDDEDLESYRIPIDTYEDLHSINQSLERVSDGEPAHLGSDEGFTVYETEEGFVYQAFENNNEMVLTGKESTLKDIVPGLDYLSG